MDGSIFDLKYEDSVSVLSKAVISGDLKNIKKLLISGKSPQATDNRGWTCIHYCVASNQLEALKLILKLRAKNKAHLVNLTTWENITPLILAFKTKNTSIKMVKVLLKAGADAKLSTHTKLSPLHLACLKKGNIDFVKLLIQYGADVNAQEDLTLFTPLHFAVTDSLDLEIIEYLVKLSNLYVKNTFNRSAFLEACFSNFTEAVKLFLEFDKNLSNHIDDIPPLVFAGYLGNFEMANLLLESGANVNIKCKALIPNENHSEAIFLDLENYLPIQSSLINIDIFKLLLEATDFNKVKQLNSSYCEFPLFILIHGKDHLFYEALLQSSFPSELKTISCQGLINFLSKCSWEIPLLIKKFKLCFKYNFNLEPESCFQNLLCLISEEENLKKFFDFIYQLCEMGISSVNLSNHKKTVSLLIENLLKNNEVLENGGLALLVCKSLSQKVLSLKKICRMIIRRHIKLIAQNDWEAYIMIKHLDLPGSLKKFLVFDI